MATSMHPGGETGESLTRVQSFDLQSVVRERELGVTFALKEIVAPAKKVQELFDLIAPSHINFFPEQQKRVIKDQADAFYNFLEQCAQFQIEGAQPSPTEAKTALVTKAEGLYQQYFNTLFPLISFATARTQDFSRLEQEARAASQHVKDEVDRLVSELEGQKEAADEILTEVRAVAAEQGVSQQAVHFRNESEEHVSEAATWKVWTQWAIGILVAYGILSIFLHKIPFLAPATTYDAVQLAVSKLLIFVVLGYGLTLCAKNYLAHRHNAVVNKHRQNALATYTTIADAANDASGRDIVLSHAADCIFSPQDTGYHDASKRSADAPPTLQLMPRLGSAADTSH